MRPKTSSARRLSLGPEALDVSVFLETGSWAGSIDNFDEGALWQDCFRPIEGGHFFLARGLESQTLGPRRILGFEAFTEIEPRNQNLVWNDWTSKEHSL